MAPPRDEPPRNGNGIHTAWRTWALGIAATLLVSLIGNGILFQRETRETLRGQEERLKSLEGRARDAIIREFERIDKRLERLEGGAQPKPGYRLQSEESRPFNLDEFKK